MNFMRIKIVIEKGEDGFLVGHCPSLKGCWSQGKSEEEVLKNLREAISLYLEPDPQDVRRSPSRKIRELTV